MFIHLQGVHIGVWVHIFSSGMLSALHLAHHLIVGCPVKEMLFWVVKCVKEVVALVHVLVHILCMDLKSIFGTFL